ncbi:MAG: FHA domain-containing protein [Fimbriiglobus sp.]
MKPWLVVVRGENLGVVYPILEGTNIIGRTSDQPVDVDLDGQEAVNRVWTSRRHSVVKYDQGELVIEDLNSLNGTFVNRNKIPAGTGVPLLEGDTIQLGTVQLRVSFSVTKPKA